MLVCCRSSKSPDRRCRSSTMPVGGFTPDRNDPPPPNICLGSHSLPSTAGAQRVRPVVAGRQQRRSGIASPTGTLHPRQVFAWVLTLYLLLPVLKEFVPALPVGNSAGLAPVGDCIPDRNAPPPPNICSPSHSLPSAAGGPRVRPGFTGRQQRRSGIASPTGTIHPRQIFA